MVDIIEARIMTALDALLEHEPMDDGLCPWCGAFRAEWTGDLRTDHWENRPWQRLVDAYPIWMAD